MAFGVPGEGLTRAGGGVPVRVVAVGVGSTSTVADGLQGVGLRRTSGTPSTQSRRAARFVDEVAPVLAVSQEVSNPLTVLGVDRVDAEQIR